MQGDKQEQVTIDNIGRIVEENRDRLGELAENMSEQRQWRRSMEEKWTAVATREDLKEQVEALLAKTDASLARTETSLARADANTVRQRSRDIWLLFGGVAALLTLFEWLGRTLPVGP